MFVKSQEKLCWYGLDEMNEVSLPQHHWKTEHEYTFVTEQGYSFEVILIFFILS